MMKCHRPLNHSFKVYLFAFCTALFLAISLSACTTDQQGGWKSKGGSRNPITPPSFPTADDLSMDTRLAPAARINQVVGFDKDLLVCEDKSSTEGKNPQLAFDIIGSFIGFELYEVKNEIIPSEIKTFENLDTDQFSSLKDLELEPISSSEEFLENYIESIKPVSPHFANIISGIIEKSSETKTPQVPWLVKYKTSKDGRECFTANILEKNWSDQSYEVLNPKLLSQISAQDQSLLLLDTALKIYSVNSGYFDHDNLKNFVFYSHTSDFKKQMNSGKVTSEMFKKLIKTFLPEYVDQ